MFGIFRKKKSQPTAPTGTALGDVEVGLQKMGYDLLPYGTAVAAVELQSGYSPVEVASHIAHTTLARDVREAGDDIFALAAFVPHASALIELLTYYKNHGLMRPAQWQNDCTAVMGIVTASSEQAKWLEQVLSDPVVGAERMAQSRIKYKT